MLFNSYAFLFLFLPLTLLGFYLIQKKNLQQWFLLLSSIIFYCYWSTTYVFLLFFTVIFDFYIADFISRSQSQGKRKAWLLLSVITNLSILGFFKYFNFFIENLNGLWQLFKLPVIGIAPLNLVLPIGISFYTFQSMCYVIDVYRRTSEAHGGLLSFAGYVTLFPHQISGPLVRHHLIVPQLEDANTYRFQPERFWQGVVFFVLGLSKKMLIADLIAAVVDPLVRNIYHVSHLEALLAMLGYTIQLYFDFSGYTDMATGLGHMMNIQFPPNFNSPYKSKSITEFWQRWHISLSSWLRDYLYISLGGNQRGLGKTYRNLILTMVIGGLWHGANWTYIIWGFFHGGLLAIERVFKSQKVDWLKYSFAKQAVTFILVNIGWIFFRAPDLKTAIYWLKKILIWNTASGTDLLFIALRYKDRFFIALLLGLLIAFFAKNTLEIRMKPSWRSSFVLAFLFVVCLMYMSEESPFLYFQF